MSLKAKKSEWKDVSRFSQGDMVRTPKTFERRCGVFRLVVTRHIHYAPHVWVAFCDGVFDNHTMDSNDIEAAKAEAELMLKEKLQAAIEEMVADCM